MHLFISVFASLIISHPDAFPRASAAAQPIPVPVHPNRTPDKCGPLVQTQGDPLDSCSAKPVVVNSTSSFGIVSMLPEHPADLAGNLFDWGSNCASTVTDICNAMSRSNTTAGQWYFATGPPAGSGDQRACQMGFWLPNDDPVNTVGKSDPNAAQIPSPQQCRNIFDGMAAAAINANSALEADTSNDWNPWMGVSINLLTNPAGQNGQKYDLPGGVGTGSAFNAGYPSYVMAQGPLGEQVEAEEEAGRMTGPFSCANYLCCNLDNTYCYDMPGP